MRPTTTTVELNDDLLAAQAGDRAAFRRLVERYYPFAYRVAYRSLGNAVDADEAAHETFIRVWTHLPRFDPTKRFTTWVYSIVTRLSLDRLRSTARQRYRPFDGEPGNDADPAGNDLQRDIERRDLAAIVLRLLGRLSPHQRLVVVLRDMEELSTDEVCAATGLTMTSVRTHLSAGRRKIRAILDREYDLKEV